MSNVVLSIGGRNFTVACAEGEESHISGLGKMIDAKLSDMGGVAGQSESRILLFAALLLADELHELRGAQRPAVQADTEQTDISAAILEQMAQRLENLATRLES